MSIVSVPFWLQQEITDIAVLDPIAAHIKFIQGDNIFGEVVPDTVINAELPLYGVFRGQQVCDLNIQFVPLILAYKVDLLIAHLAHGNGVTSAQKFHIDDILQNQVDILPITAEHSFPDAMIGYIVFLIDSEDLLAL